MRPSVRGCRDTGLAAASDHRGGDRDRLIDPRNVDLYAIRVNGDLVNVSQDQLLLDYDTINDQIHRAETNIETVSQDHETELRKQRLIFKDQIAQMLAANT